MDLNYGSGQPRPTSGYWWPMPAQNQVAPIPVPWIWKHMEGITQMIFIQLDKAAMAPVAPDLGAAGGTRCRCGCVVYTETLQRRESMCNSLPQMACGSSSVPPRTREASDGVESKVAQQPHERAKDIPAQPWKAWRKTTRAFHRRRYGTHCGGPARNDCRAYAFTVVSSDDGDDEAEERSDAQATMARWSKSCSAVDNEAAKIAQATMARWSKSCSAVDNEAAKMVAPGTLGNLQAQPTDEERSSTTWKQRRQQIDSRSSSNASTHFEQEKEAKATEQQQESNSVDGGSGVDGIFPSLPPFPLLEPAGLQQPDASVGVGDSTAKHGQQLESNSNDGSSGIDDVGRFLSPTSLLNQPRQQLQDAPVAGGTEVQGTCFSGLRQQLAQKEPKLQKEAARALRVMLSAETDTPIQQVLHAGIGPWVVYLLAEASRPDMQFEAAWILTNTASGNQEQTKAVVDMGAVPILAALSRSPDVNVSKQAAWALDNIATEPPFRSLVFHARGTEQ